jgi:pyruvate/2-oxoglutarate dehydrogenase complex dihydrolipoamide acyltransferase (E2) component
VLFEVETDKAVMEVEAQADHGKTRRLAREKGLDLNLLVENGVPQPYHVSDLGLLETLVPSTKAAGASASRAAAGALPMHIGARVAASGCDEFIAWLADGGGVHLEPRLLWLRFAAAAFREATGLGDKTLVVEARTVRRTDGRFADADRARLSKPVSDAGDQVPSIVLRDFTGSPITTATGSSSDSPVTPTSTSTANGARAARRTLRRHQPRNRRSAGLGRLRRDRGCRCRAGRRRGRFGRLGRAQAARTLGGAAQGVGTDDRAAGRLCPADHAGKRQGPGTMRWARQPMPPSSSAGSPRKPCAPTG